MFVNRGLLLVLVVALMAFGVVACEYVEAGSENGGDSDFPPVRSVISQAEALDMDPGRYAGRLYRGKQNSIEDRYDRRIENASGSRLDRLENARDRELTELDFNYEDLCIALERRDYVCAESRDG